MSPLQLTVASVFMTQLQFDRPAPPPPAPAARVVRQGTRESPNPALEEFEDDLILENRAMVLEVQSLMLRQLLERVIEQEGRVVPNADGQRAMVMKRVEDTVDGLDRRLPGREPVRVQFDRRLNLEIQRVRVDIGLSGSEESRLRLAGQGDLKRYFDQVEQLRARCRDSKGDPKRLKLIIDEIAGMSRTTRAGPYGEGSIFSKVLEKIGREQKARTRRGPIIRRVSENAR